MLAHFFLNEKKEENSSRRPEDMCFIYMIWIVQRLVAHTFFLPLGNGFKNEWSTDVGNWFEN